MIESFLNAIASFFGTKIAKILWIIIIFIIIYLIQNY